MESYGRTLRSLRGALGLGVTALLAAALVPLGAGSAQAEPAPGPSLGYVCPIPLVGSQPATAAFDLDIPSGIQTGEAVEIGISGALTFDPKVTQAMRTVAATSLEGSAIVEMTIQAPGETIPLQIPVTLPTVDIPAGSPYPPLVVPIRSTSIEVAFTEPGPATLTAGDLALTLTPRKADATPTGLGTFDSACTLVAGQDPVLAAWDIHSGGPAPDPEGVTLTYTCAFPLIGQQPVVATFQPDGPATVEVGQQVSFGADVSVTLSDKTHHALTLVHAATVDSGGSAALTVDGPKRDDVSLLGALDLNRLTVPAGPPYTTLTADGDLTSTGVTFTRHGNGEVRIGDLALTLAPHRADGTWTGLRVFSVACTQDPGQDTVLTEFEVVRAAD
ncbi:DUF6801 domain-containing protein [Streptomyces sp. URMC 129]|uniref:DUF6801 domain-containing protein n=1 Tax=Streptomyces sp. URMC 129 TaxID=3423407 RepID=UPI003F1D25F6